MNASEKISIKTFCEKLTWNYQYFRKKHLKQVKITRGPLFPVCTCTHKVHFRKFLTCYFMLHVSFADQWHKTSVYDQQPRGKKLVLYLQITLTQLSGRQKTHPDSCLHYLLFIASTWIYSYTLIKSIFYSQT